SDPPVAAAAPAPPASFPPAPAAPAPVMTGAPESADEPVGAKSNGEGLVLSPVVRQLVAEYGIDPASITGTGKGGRITRGDVLAFIDRRAAGAEAGPSASVASAVPGQATTPAVVAASPVSTAVPPSSPVSSAASSYSPVAG